MSSNCNNSTAPINISQGSIKANCDSKCRYFHKYPISKCVVHNRGNYLALDYTNGQRPSASYNTIKMEVSDIRIYTPSLHTYDGKYQAGEIIINHRGNDDPLLVCIPIKQSNETANSTSLLKSIIDYTLTNAPNNGESVNVNITNFTLEEFIPNSPFYSYEGNLLYDPCSGNNNYVVFHPNNGFVSLDENYVKKLKNLISTHTYSIKDGPLLFYNKSGSVNSMYSGGGRGKGIYIDCKPVGEQGEILYNVNKDGSSGSSSVKFDAEKFFTNPFVLTILSLIGVYGVYRISKIGWDKFKDTKGE